MPLNQGDLSYYPQYKRGAKRLKAKTIATKEEFIKGDMARFYKKKRLSAEQMIKMKRRQQSSGGGLLKRYMQGTAGSQPR